MIIHSHRECHELISRHRKPSQAIIESWTGYMACFSIVDQCKSYWLDLYGLSSFKCLPFIMWWMIVADGTIADIVVCRFDQDCSMTLKNLNSSLSGNCCPEYVWMLSHSSWRAQQCSRDIINLAPCETDWFLSILIWRHTACTVKLIHCLMTDRTLRLSYNFMLHFNLLRLVSHTFVQFVWN